MYIQYTHNFKSRNNVLMKVLEAERYRLSLLEEKIREVLNMLRTLNTMVSIARSFYLSLFIPLCISLQEAKSYLLSLFEVKIREVFKITRTRITSLISVLSVLCFLLLYVSAWLFMAQTSFYFSWIVSCSAL